MNKLTKDQILIAISTVILLFTAMITWNIYSWLTLLAIIVILIAWYFKNRQTAASRCLFEGKGNGGHKQFIIDFIHRWYVAL